jgi:hypothetical protein
MKLILFVRFAPMALLLVGLAGCGGGGATPSAASTGPLVIGPHGGQAHPLPGEKGYAEVVAEIPKGQTDPVVVVYFLKPDLKSPLAPLPTDARIKTGGAKVPLSPAPGASKDATGPGRMVSAPLQADPDRVSGELAATIEGQPFSTTFNIGQ